MEKNNLNYLNRGTPYTCIVGEIPPSNNEGTPSCVFWRKIPPFIFDREGREQLIMNNDIKYNIIDKMIEYLENIKKESISISIVPPHIEEIYGLSDGTVYGKMEMDIHIEFNDLYQKTNNVVSSWEKL